MSHVSYLECTLCKRHFEPAPGLMTCPRCGEKGILDVQYDYDRIRKELTREILAADNTSSIWRYLPLLPVDKELTRGTLRVGMTPLYKADNLAKVLGAKNLYVKDEGVNPTQSLKDRASVIACVKAKEAGVETISCSSTGNAASSLAGNAAKLGLKSVIFVPKRAPLGKLAQLIYYGSTLIKVDGDYKAAFELSKLAIDRYGWYNRNAAINPYLVEGKKTVALEIAEQMGFSVPDWVVVSVGDGCTIAGVYKGFSDFFRLGLIPGIPKLLGVQSSGCAPFVKAAKTNRDLEPTEEDTIADSIAVGIPRNPVKALKAVKDSLGSWIAVTDDLIIEAMKLLAKTEGIFAEPAASAVIAGLIKAYDTGLVSRDETVVLISTGNGLKDTANALKAAEEPALLPNDIDKLNAYLKKKKEIQ